MPVEDLEELGYTVWRPPADMTPAEGPTVSGHGKQWRLQATDDEEAVVTEATNHKALMDKLELAQTYFADSYAGWPSLTNVQKDAAMRNAMRALTNLIRHVRDDLTSGGS